LREDEKMFAMELYIANEMMRVVLYLELIGEVELREDEKTFAMEYTLQTK
jgi:hypothetical protein